VHFSDLFQPLLFLVSALAASVAAISGFGIGSILTPFLGLEIDIRLAVAAISIPHFIATALRCWMLRDQINRSVLIRFGTFSALGGLLGALLHAKANDPILVCVFSALLVYVGVSGLTGWLQKLSISGRWSWIAGVASGLLGGIVGNQGGIRSAALLGMNLPKGELVATGTAVGVVVDLARMPIYLWSQGADLVAIWWLIAIASAGCILGTVTGKSILSRLSEETFRRVLYLLILVLGVYMLFQIKAH
jgi:uncharacterized protein